MKANAQFIAEVIKSLKSQKKIEKSALTLSDLDGYVLQGDVLREFINLGSEDTDFIKRLNVRFAESGRLRAFSRSFTGRVLHASGEGQALPQSQQSAPDFVGPEIITKSYQAEVPITYDALKKNLLGEALLGDIMDALSSAIMNDMEYFVLNSALTATDPDENKFDGMRAQAGSTVDLGGAALTLATLRTIWRQIPPKYRKRRDALMFLVHADSEDYLRSIYANRATQLGDITLTEDNELRWHGTPIVGTGKMPDNLGTPPEHTDALLFHPDNAVVAIDNEIEMLVDDDKRAGVKVIVARVNFAFAYVRPELAVRGYNLVIG